MANQLLHSGALGRHTIVSPMTPTPIIEDQPMDQPQSRCYMYSLDYPLGKIFEGTAAIADAEDNGWVDSPALLEPKTQAKATKGGKVKATNGDKNR